MADGIGYSGTFLMSLMAVQLATCGTIFRERDTIESLKQARKEIQYVREDLERLGNPAMDSNGLLDLRVEDVLGGPVPETFYVIDGKNVYLLIDGKAMGEYFPLRAEKGKQ